MTRPRLYRRGRTAAATAATAGLLALNAPWAGANTVEGPQFSPAAVVDTQQWSAARASDELDFDLLEAQSISVGDAMHLRFLLHNPTSSTVDDLQITSRRGDAVASTDSAREQLAGGAFPYFGASTTADSLAPEETKEVELIVPTALADETTLAIDEPGAYPLMFTLTGSRDGQATSFAEERLIYDVAPSATPEPGQEPEQATPQPDQAVQQDPPQQHALTVVYPITSEIDIVPGDTGGEGLILSNDNLASELAEGGRLSALLDSYFSHNLRGAGCVALDPALIDTVDRMARGYTVNQTRPSVAQRPQRLRDSWFDSDRDTRGEPGTGSQAAAAWLARLKNLDCTMTMPWANSDASAVAHTNNGFLKYEATQRGAETIERITGKPVSTDLLAVGSGYISQSLDVPTLVANNSQWKGRAATFDASLGALLAHTGSKPQTVGYSNPQLRYDYSMDSGLSRALSGAAGLSVAARAGDTVAKLPNYQGESSAEAALDAAQSLVDSGTSTARGVAQLPIEDQDSAQPGSPYADPAAFSDAEIVRVEQQARYTDDLTNIMVNDPSIALTRYGFTLPLRRGLISSFSITDRATSAQFSEAVATSNERLEKQSEMLRELRDSVSLIPPGNVYTRVSESSPLLIVAENGLPLPVEARMLYEASDDSVLNTPATVRIPAKGSITVSMTASMPNDTDRSDIRLWLATPNESTISQPINIAVQTRAGILSVYGVGVIAALALVLATLFRLGKKKKNRRQR
ncbi:MULTISPECIES: hypothetical protein [Corynebacterium]|uniref:hypothetical protein n=1 Tax=Corynebacterium TaxID=1716 RepID=UPI00257F7BB7|nr:MULTISPECIES: hypothetical protein [Corynebacterium]